MSKLIKIVFVLLVSSSIIFAQSAGKSGLSFLKFGFGARNLAMGDIGSVSASDVTSLNYNPALLSGFSNSEIMFTHNEQVQDVRSELFGVSFKLLGLPFALGVNTTSVSNIEVRTVPGDPESTFNAHFFSSSLSTGFNLTDNISVGLTAKYLYEGMLSDDADGMAYDFGAFYKSPVEGLSFGAAIRNLGSMSQLRVEKTKLPSDFRLGSLYSKSIENINSRITIGAEFQKYVNQNESHINIGGEFLYNNLIAVRAGYQTNYELTGISAGFGLKWSKLFFDYAFVPFSYDFGTNHIISIKFRF